MRAHRSTRTDTISQKIISGDENVHATKLIQYVRVNDQLGCIWTRKPGELGSSFIHSNLSKNFIFFHTSPQFSSLSASSPHNTRTHHENRL